MEEDEYNKRNKRTKSWYGEMAANNVLRKIFK